MSAAKSHQQVKCIFGLAKAKGLDNDELHTLVAEATRKGNRDGKTSIAALNFIEADAVIARLGGEPFAARRTVQHRRQKAGVVQLAQPSHLQLMRDLGSKRHIGEDELARLAKRMRLPYPPHTTSQTNKIVEALKSMNKRDEELQEAMQ